MCKPSVNSAENWNIFLRQMLTHPTSPTQLFRAPCTRDSQPNEKKKKILNLFLRFYLRNLPKKIRCSRWRLPACLRELRETNFPMGSKRGSADAASEWRPAWFSSPRLPWFAPTARASSALPPESDCADIPAQPMASRVGPPTSPSIGKCTRPSRCRACGTRCCPWRKLSAKAGNDFKFVGGERRSLPQHSSLRNWRNFLSIRGKINWLRALPIQTLKL